MRLLGTLGGSECILCVRDVNYWGSKVDSDRQNSKMTPQDSCLLVYMPNIIPSP